MEEHTRASMDGTVLEQVRDRLRTMLAGFGQRRILGAQLGPLVNEAIESGNTYKSYLEGSEPPTLRAFVQKYLSDIVSESGEYSGSDQFYEVRTAEGEPVNSRPADGVFWKTFVAVSPLFTLTCETETFELQTFPIGSEIPERWKPIDSVTLDEHQRICEGFCDQLDSMGKQTDSLRRIAAEYSATSYPLWLAALRSFVPRLDREWSIFRRTRLMGLFRERLENLSIPSESVDALVLEIANDQERAHQFDLRERKSYGLQNSSGSIDSNATDADMRRLFHTIVDQMNAGDLRKIAIPFGAIWWVLNNK